MIESLPVYYEKVPNLAQELENSGNLAVLVLDASRFAAIEEQYGTETYMAVRQRIFKLFADQSGKEFREEDILALDEPRGLRFILFLGRKRKATPNVYANLESLRERLASVFIPKLARTALPYLKNPPDISIGIGLALHNPLVHPHRIIVRALREAYEHADWQRCADDLQVRQRLQEIILRGRVVTAFQPIVRIQDRKALGFEALSRGAPGTSLQSADLLFGAAIKHNLLVELDRLCRMRALLCSNRLPADVQIFVNTLPATIRDPEFRGKHLIGFLEKAKVTPNRIVIEITEKLVIENLSLFQDAMSYFTDLGMALAVDDVGSGYSGLETIARLRPAYLKVDTALVRDVHVSLVNREMLKAIISLGRGIGSRVIAEGIQTAEELNTLLSMGVEYGQGFYLGRPELLPE
ncbi:MAG: EAL domain-containing protein [Acidobacteriia bacterium]|nr:EAL domain-containing protein [Terriglobia bacterium]